MRIISGKLKGREIKNKFIDGTRPTMDRVKESVFSTIQNDIKDKVCLDLFAGTGNLGIEAISNGAKKCYFVDNNIRCISEIKNVVDKFQIKEESIILNMDYINAINYFNKNNIKFDLIFLDPPYKYNIITEILNLIHEYNLLNEDGIIVCEYEKDEVDIDFYELKKDKKYGSKKVSIYKN